jgi:hypothetical protein
MYLLHNVRVSVLRFSPVSISPHIFHVHFYRNTSRIRRTSRRSLRTFNQNKASYLISRNIRRTRTFTLRDFRLLPRRKQDIRSHVKSRSLD